MATKVWREEGGGGWGRGMGPVIGNHGCMLLPRSWFISFCRTQSVCDQTPFYYGGYF